MNSARHRAFAASLANRPASSLVASRPPVSNLAPVLSHPASRLLAATAAISLCQPTCHPVPSNPLYSLLDFRRRIGLVDRRPDSFRSTCSLRPPDPFRPLGPCHLASCPS